MIDFALNRQPIVQNEFLVTSLIDVCQHLGLEVALGAADGRELDFLRAHGNRSGLPGNTIRQLPISKTSLDGVIVHPRGSDEVLGLEKFRHEAGARTVEDFLHAAKLSDFSRVHDRHPVRDGESFVLIVGDHDEGHSKALLDLPQLHLHLDPQGGVERAHGLIKQEDFWLIG